MHSANLQARWLLLLVVIVYSSIPRAGEAHKEDQHIELVSDFSPSSKDLIDCDYDMSKVGPPMEIHMKLMGPAKKMPHFPMDKWHYPKAGPMMMPIFAKMDMHHHEHDDHQHSDKGEHYEVEHDDMVGGKHWMSDYGDEDHDEHKSEKPRLDYNNPEAQVQVWKNVVSYFPSGQKELSKYKSKMVNNNQPTKGGNQHHQQQLKVDHWGKRKLSNAPPAPIANYLKRPTADDYQQKYEPAKHSPAQKQEKFEQILQRHESPHAKGFDQPQRQEKFDGRDQQQVVEKHEDIKGQQPKQDHLPVKGLDRPEQQSPIKGFGIPQRHEQTPIKGSDQQQQQKQEQAPIKGLGQHDTKQPKGQFEIIVKVQDEHAAKGEAKSVAPPPKSPAQVATSKKDQDSLNKIEQQQQQQKHDDSDVKGRAQVDDEWAGAKRGSSLEFQVAEADPTPESRVRGQLQHAADLARSLGNRTLAAPAPDGTNHTVRFDKITGLSSLLHDRHLLVPDTESSRSSPSSGGDMKPVYLGRGHLQPISSERRTQARLSCDFGDPNQANKMSISNVEWARFVGNYNSDQVEPPFGCQLNSCRLERVQTDPVVTIHPRPSVQSYANGEAPSYSLTLHEVDDKHMGVYRCSALRQMDDGRRELVYRIIPYE